MQGDPVAGRAVYESANCANCHSGVLWTLSERYYDPILGQDNRGLSLASQGIQAIGVRSDLDDDPEKLADQIHDAAGHWITPGLIDCHTHIVYAGHRAHEFEMRLEGASYEAKGLYRPEIDCIMFSRNMIRFCDVCRRAIAQIIDLYT